MPDAVVSDIALGDADGVELCLGLSERFPRIRFVLVTGSPAHAERARRAGFERVLLKPFSADALRDALHD